MQIESARIRRFQPSDLGDLCRISKQTADNGEDGRAVFGDPRLPGDV